MSIFSIIHKSQLEGASRLDADYYQSEYLELKNILKNRDCLTFREVTHFIKKGIFDISPERYMDSGIPFVRVQNIRNGLINDNNLVYLSMEDHKIENKTELGSLDLVFSKVGTVGEIALLSPAHNKWNFSQNVIGAKIKKEQISQAYLLFFFLSKFGQLQIKRAEMFQVQPKLELEDIRNLKIVKIKNAEMYDSYLRKVLQWQDESKKQYQQAENLLLEELGLKDFQIIDDLASEVNFSDVIGVGRMDADYFQPKYQWLINKIEKKKRMLEMAKRIVKSIKLIPDIEYNYIEISDVNAGNGEVAFNRILGKELPANAKIGLNGGELIISKVRPTRGAVAIISRAFNDNFVASGAFSVFNVDYPTREYLQVVFRSIVGKLQLERPTTGTSYPTITDEDIENMWVPDFSLNFQQKIADLVRKSHDARNKSKELLNEAKQKVEEMIEKGGE